MGIIEDGVDDDEARYFEVPSAGRHGRSPAITLESMTPLAQVEQGAGFRIDNENNIP